MAIAILHLLIEEQEEEVEEEEEEEGGDADRFEAAAFALVSIQGDGVAS